MHQSSAYHSRHLAMCGRLKWQAEVEGHGPSYAKFMTPIFAKIVSESAYIRSS